jgi:hypothetical protein
MKNTLLIICVLIIVAGAFYVMNSYDPEPVVHVETIYEKDTIYIVGETQIITKTITKTRIDTVLIRDTLFITEIAEMDTAFKEGELFVQYFLEPQIFNLEWNPYPVPVVTKTIKETIHLPYDAAWYETRTFGFLTGCLLTGTLVWMVK